VPLVYVDANVLILAADGLRPGSLAAFRLLDNASLKFAVSDFLRLEVLPKAVFHRQTLEAGFYRRFFDQASVWAMMEPRLGRTALDLGQRFGLAGMDALHVAAAMSVRADVFVTDEKPSKPIHRVTTIPIMKL
jgi:predicted nucleic acid-binding protein